MVCEACLHNEFAPEKLIIATVTFFFVTEVLHPHWFWFFKKDNKNNWVQDVYHIKFVNFFDGFAFKNGEESAFITALELMNLPAFCHFPAFNFLQSIFNDVEGSDTCLSFFLDV